MKDLYTKPELELDEFKLVDVLTSSTDEAGGSDAEEGDDF